MAIALNQIGQQSLTVTGAAVGLTAPPVTTGDLRNEFGLLNRQSVRGFLVSVRDQPVRWRADGIDPTGAVLDNLLSPGDVLDLTEPRYDYRGMFGKIKFVLDTTATGNATVEVAMFA